MDVIEENLIPEEDDVADFSLPCEKLANVRLKEGIEVEKLLQNKGIFIEPDIEEDYEAVNGKNYFSTNEQELQELVNSYAYNSDEDNFEVKARKMTNLTDDGGVRKRIIAPGIESDGPVPEKGSVTIHYSLVIEGQDEPFDSTYLRGKSERHRIDDNRLIRGLDIAVRSMKNHEKSEFVIEPDYAFGRMGCPPRVPEEATILARVELISFAEEGESEAILSLPPDERKKQYQYKGILKVVQKEHRTGNSFANKDEYKSASKCYERACKLLEELELANDEEEKEQQHILLKLYRNRGLCYTRINWPKRACLVLQDALKIDETDAKLNYRMGVAKRMLCHYQDSRRYLMKALQAQPGNAEIGAELASVDMLMKKERDDQKLMCARMFSGGKKVDKNAIKGSMEDEDYAEIVEQLELFKRDLNQKELPLPSGFDQGSIRLIEDIAHRMNLTLVPGKVENQYKVIRKS